MTEPDDIEKSHIIQELRAEIVLLEEIIQHSRSLLRRTEALIAPNLSWLGEETEADPARHAPVKPLVVSISPVVLP